MTTTRRAECVLQIPRFDHSAVAHKMGFRVGRSGTISQRSAPASHRDEKHFVVCKTNSHEGHLVGYQPAIGGLSVSGYDQEKWVEFYKSAVLELEQSLIAGRIADARAEIVKRIEALRNIPGLHGDERQAIEDALNTLGLLDREDAKQRSIAPKIKRPND